MSTNILIVDDDKAIITLGKAILEQEGYTFFSASNSSRAISLIDSHTIDLIIFAKELPDISGADFAKELREHSDTEDIPLMMIVDPDEVDQMNANLDSPLDDFLPSNFGTSELVTKVIALLSSRVSKQKNVISAGNGELDSKMGGGIPLGSLTLIEGSSGAGKSVLTQQMIYGSLNDGFKVSLFTSENNITSIIKQMRSLDLDIIDFMLLGRVRVFPMELTRLGPTAPKLILKAMAKERPQDMIVVDSITMGIGSSSTEDILSFFEESKRLCTAGSTVVIVLHSHAVDREAMVRIRSLCDAHLQMRTEEVGKKLVKTLEVTKVLGADKTTGNIVSFEVEPGWGMRVIPVSKVKG